jgi:diketogulonate reductase-like aldo/keto reductase
VHRDGAPHGQPDRAAPDLQRGALVAYLRGRPGPLDHVCARIAARHGVDESAILLRWVMQQGCIAVSTSSRLERLRDYLVQVPGFELSAEEMEELAREGEGKNFRGTLLMDMGRSAGIRLE